MVTPQLHGILSQHPPAQHFKFQKQYMKTSLSIAAFLVSTIISSQVIINPGSKTAVTNSSVSVEFGSEERGIILPYVTASDAANAVPGTFIMDHSDRAMKLKLGNGTWQNLTGGAATTNSIVNPFSVIAENSTAKSVIGPANVPQAHVPGILILSESDKAMILRQVA